MFLVVILVSVLDSDSSSASSINPQPSKSPISTIFSSPRRSVPLPLIVVLIRYIVCSSLVAHIFFEKSATSSHTAIAMSQNRWYGRYVRGMRLLGSTSVGKRYNLGAPENGIQVFASAAIAKRLDNNTFEAVDGIKITISGCVNRLCTLSYDFSTEEKSKHRLSRAFVDCRFTLPPQRLVVENRSSSRLTPKSISKPQAR